MIITTVPNLPTHCEFCDSKLVWNGVNLVCNNFSCSNKTEEKLKSWIINIAPVNGIGWKTIKKFLDVYNIKNLTDLYNAVNNPFPFNNNQVRQNSEEYLFNEVLDKLSCPISVSQFLLALNIPGFGKIGAKRVEDSKKSREFFGSIIDNNKDNISFWYKVVQDKNVVDSLFDFVNRQYFINCYCLVKDQIIFDNIESKKQNKGSVVITGTMSMKREDFVKLLEINGWKVENKINKNIKYLITNTPDSGTTKNKEADFLGIAKITEKKFLNYILYE